MEISTKLPYVWLLMVLLWNLSFGIK